MGIKSRLPKHTLHIWHRLKNTPTNKNPCQWFKVEYGFCRWLRFFLFWQLDLCVLLKYGSGLSAENLLFQKKKKRQGNTKMSEEQKTQQKNGSFIVDQVYRFKRPYYVPLSFLLLSFYAGYYCYACFVCVCVWHKCACSQAIFMKYLRHEWKWHRYIYYSYIVKAPDGPFVRDNRLHC